MTENKSIVCSICKKDLDNPDFARNYPNFVCRECDARALNSRGESPEHDGIHDGGDNPIFIDGKKCWRRYNYGGYVTMQDEFDCRDLGEFYDKYECVF